MNKILSKIIFTGLLLCLSQVASALSLGEITVKSSFAQPFLAEIALPSYKAEEMESIEIHLASDQQFEERGLEVLPIFREFRFSVEENKEGKLYIKISSKNAIKELSISFLVEVTWNGGRIIKDFDILLTPEAITQLWEEEKQVEVLAEAPQTLTTLAEKKSIEEANFPLPTPVISEPSDIKPQNSPPANLSKQNTRVSDNNRLYYPSVNRGETLSSVAYKMRPDETISLNQMMVALYEQNKEAFINENINLLKAGANLSIEDVATLTQISKGAANMLAQQYINKANPRRVDIAENSKEREPPEVPSEQQSTNLLQISSVAEENIPPEVMEQIKKEQLASAEEELESAKAAARKLQDENTKLRERIAILEQELNIAAEQLFLASLKDENLENPLNKNSATQQADNLLVMNTDIALEGAEKSSFLERLIEHRNAIALTIALLLLLALLALRKKEQILDLIYEFKERGRKDDQLA